MKQGFLILTTLLIISASCARAQDNLFTVLSVKGNITINNITAKPGNKLKAADKLVVPENGYIALLHANGKTAELKKAGAYETSTLSAALLKGDNTLTKKFTDFVAKEMSSSKQSGKMSMLGAVSRGGTASIIIAGPSNDILLENSCVFKWFSLNISKGYIFRLKNVHGQTIHTLQTSDTMLSVNFSNFGLVPGFPYYWIVSDAVNQAVSTGDNIIKIAAQQYKNALSDSASSLKKEGLDEKSAVDAFVMAKYYERNGCNSTALSYYKTAYQLSLGAEEFAKEYARCLADQNLAAEAEIIVKGIK